MVTLKFVLNNKSITVPMSVDTCSKSDYLIILNWQALFSIILLIKSVLNPIQFLDEHKQIGKKKKDTMCYSKKPKYPNILVYVVYARLWWCCMSTWLGGTAFPRIHFHVPFCIGMTQEGFLGDL